MNLSPSVRQRLLSALALLSFFVMWELICLAGGISDLILPRPSQIAVVLWEKMPLLWPHTVQTLKTTLAGFALGVLIGIVIGVAETLSGFYLPEGFKEVAAYVVMLSVLLLFPSGLLGERTRKKV